MKVSLRWLSEYLEPQLSLSVHKVAEQLNRLSVEVEQIEHFCQGSTGLVIVEIRKKAPFPAAQKLQLVTIFDGACEYEIVCGAPNVPNGEDKKLAVWAKPGSFVSGREITPKEIRGVVSLGMLCSAEEIGLPKSLSDGLLLFEKGEAPAGADFIKYFGLPDSVLTLNITPNRSDLLGHLGVAREIAALFSDQGYVFSASKKMENMRRIGFLNDRLSQEVYPDIELGQGCTKYIGARIEGLIYSVTPLRARLRLSLLGFASISPVVDAIQMVMLETGVPLHAFDVKHFMSNNKPSIWVGCAEKEELLTTLDDVQRMVQPGDLIVCSKEGPSGEPVIGAFAGVIGGQSTKITLDTKIVFIEGAEFAADFVRSTAKRHKIQTEASYRFERGIDEELLDYSMSVCIDSVLSWTGGIFVGTARTESKYDKSRPKIAWSVAHTNAVLGTDLSHEEQQKALLKLGFSLTSVTPEGGLVIVPSSRKDITRSIDLVEEIGRIVGYDKIPAVLPTFTNNERLLVDERWGTGFYRWMKQIRDICVQLGMTEIKTLPFVLPNKDDQKEIAVVIQNPLGEDSSYLRRKMVESFQPIIAKQIQQGTKELTLFELGEVFSRGDRDGQFLEQAKLVGVLMGHRFEGASWIKNRPMDFYDAKGVIEELLVRLGFDEYRPQMDGLCFEFIKHDDEKDFLMHPGVSCKVRLLDGTWAVDIGFVGELHPMMQKRLGADQSIFWFELSIDELFNFSPKRKAKHFVPWSRFPVVRRDISFYIPEDVSFRLIQECMYSLRVGIFDEVVLLEEYKEKGKVPDGKKALLIQCVYRTADRTLRDEEVKVAHEALIDKLQESFGVEIR